MARHLAAFYSSLTNPTVAALNAVPDTQIFSVGTIQRVPPAMPNVCMAEASYVATTLTLAEVQTPSLRVLANYDISPLNLTAPPTNAFSYDDRYDNPLKLTGNEDLQAVMTGTSTGAQDAYVILEYCDGPAKPDMRNSFTIQATGAATLSAGAYVNTALTFNTTLPAGTYDVIGFRAEGAHLAAARIAFIGQVNRPGVLGVATAAQEDNLRMRQGGAGVFGSFDINQPPTVDCLGITDTAQVFYFDLVKTK